MKTFSAITSKFEKLLRFLPGGIRKPIEREWTFLKELFLERRAPRIVVVGPDAEAFVSSVLFSHPEDLKLGAGDADWHSGVEQDERPWHTFRRRGGLQLAIANQDSRFARSVIGDAAPDLFIFLAAEEVQPESFALLKQLQTYERQRYGITAPIVAVGQQTAELWEALHEDEALSASVAAVVPGAGRENILNAIASALPEAARLEFARVTGDKAVQREIATALTRSASAVSAGIGAQPIPLADFPFITTLQVILIAGIIHISGREWTLRMARDFLGALGVNIGAGLLFREGARAAVKILPGFGNAISGAVAGAGTLAIGRAAAAYFIEGHSLEEARRRFRFLRWKG
ncbi:MAG: hypothetical protein WCP06_00345 [Verrucomicrobiota bacterium]